MEGPSAASTATMPVLPPEILLMIANFSIQAFTEEQSWFDLSHVSIMFRNKVERHIMDQYPNNALCTELERQLHPGCALDTFDRDPELARRCYVECTDVTFETVRLFFDGFYHFDKYIALFKEEKTRSIHELVKMQSQLEQISILQSNDSQVYENQANSDSVLAAPVIPTLKLVHKRHSEYMHNSTSCTQYTTNIGLPLVTTIEQDVLGKGRLVVGCDWRRIWTAKCTSLRIDTVAARNSPLNRAIPAQTASDMTNDTIINNPRTLASKILAPSGNTMEANSRRNEPEQNEPEQNEPEQNEPAQNESGEKHYDLMEPEEEKSAEDEAKEIVSTETEPKGETPWFKLRVLGTKIRSRFVPKKSNDQLLKQ